MRSATVAVLILVTAAACGGGHGTETFSASRVIATFTADRLSIGRDPSAGCGKRPLPKGATAVTPRTCNTMTISIGNRAWPVPVTTLIPSRPPLGYQVLVYSTAGKVAQLAASGLLRSTTDPLFRKRLDYLHRANIVVMCAQCSKGTITILRRALSDL